VPKKWNFAAFCSKTFKRGPMRIFYCKKQGTLQSTENPVETNPDGVPIKRKRGRPRKIRPIDNAVDDDLHMQLAHKIARIETSSPMRAAAVPVVL
jgi:hypothetical protein